jgi:hypothetical protein
VSSELEAAMRERYGTVDELERELYGRPTPRRRRAPRPKEEPRVTSHARLLHPCGHYVYTERHGAGPAVFPALCWYCRREVHP